MAIKKTADTEVKKTEEVGAMETPSKATFSVAKLRLHCRKLFGVSTTAYDGATHGLSGEYTIEAMKAIITAWNKKEVK